MISKSIKKCPVEVALGLLGRKWTIHILRDLLRGSHKFTHFLTNNSKLTTKVLSTRLKELEQAGLVNKTVASTTPLVIQYSLTQKGTSIYPVIVELSKFSIYQYPEEVFKEEPHDKDAALQEARDRFSVALTLSA